jgi:hypothetical protein
MADTPRFAFRLIAGALIVVGLAVPAAFATASGEPSPSVAFQQNWDRTDLPVLNQVVQRSWIWGASVPGSPTTEPYAESPGATRTVAYFDKARMEISHPGSDPSSPWYVTNGLLTTEMITGRLQLGDTSFEQHAPADINIAGDSNDPTSPTYASFSHVTNAPSLPAGTVIDQTIDRSGTVGQDPSLARFNVTASVEVGETGHTVASVFWAFMTSSGPIDQGNVTVEGSLFQNPFYATGLPISEAYWTSVKVKGIEQLVLVQAFERRVLTYTPDNPDGWKVEAGNVGQHYFTWRYKVLATSSGPAVSDDSSNTNNPNPGVAPGSTDSSPTSPDGTVVGSGSHANGDQAGGTDKDNGGGDAGTGNSSGNHKTCNQTNQSSSSGNSQKSSQSNSSTIDQSGPGNNVAECHQSNTNVQSP